jgi:hypothetical protein
MKRFKWTIAILLVALMPCAYADAISNFTIVQITVSVGPNNGTGDNLHFTLIGPGTNIAGTGGIACFDWCSTLNPVSPGQVFPGFGQIFIEFFSNAMVGGKNYDPTKDIAFSSGFFIDSLGSITLPANGSDVTACLPARAQSPITGFVGEGPTFTQMNLNLPAGGSFCTTWNFAGGQYTFVHGNFSVSTVPEPGTLYLMGSGLVAVFGAALRKRTATGPSRVPDF